MTKKRQHDRRVDDSRRHQEHHHRRPERNVVFRRLCQLDEKWRARAQTENKQSGLERRVKGRELQGDNHQKGRDDEVGHQHL